MSQRSYPMTLAETASIFAETLVRSALFEQAQTPEEQQAIAWAEADGAATFLVNIPARFDFERALVAERAAGYVSPARLKALTDEAWGRWYEQSLCRYHPCSGPPRRTSPSRAWVLQLPLPVRLFVQPRRLSATDASPEGGRTEYGTGLPRPAARYLRMSAEDLVAKHLGQDIRQSAFWQGSLALVEAAVERFAQTCG